MDSLFQLIIWYSAKLFKNVSNWLQSPLNIPGVTPLTPPEVGAGAGTTTTVASTDMVMGGLRG